MQAIKWEKSGNICDQCVQGRLVLYQRHLRSVEPRRSPPYPAIVSKISACVEAGGATCLTPVQLVKILHPEIFYYCEVSKC